MDFEVEWSAKRKKAWIQALGNYIAALRKAKGLSTTQLGNLLEIDRANVTRIEKGRVTPSVFVIKKICDVLEISLEKFWKGFIQKI